jgi:hypothetical protein
MAIDDQAIDVGGPDYIAQNMGMVQKRLILGNKRRKYPFMIHIRDLTLFFLEKDLFTFKQQLEKVRVQASLTNADGLFLPTIQQAFSRSFFV